MRYVDLYLDSDSKTPVAFDCIQIGEAAQTRTPTVKRFTMADGSPCIYPAAKDTAAVTLLLECSAENAAAISRAAHYGSLIIAGMSYGTNRRQYPQKTAAYLPEQKGVTGYMTGSVDITEISSTADLYNVSIPLQLLVSASGETEMTDVPAVKITELYIDGIQEKLENYRYRPVGTFVRRHVIYADAAVVSISCKTSVPDGAVLLTTVERDGEVLLTGDAVLEGLLLLQPGENEFLLTVRKAEDMNYKPQYVQFTVYRKKCVLVTNNGSILTIGNNALLCVKGDTK